jgi:hypothetical protein
LPLIKDTYLKLILQSRFFLPMTMVNFSGRIRSINEMPKLILISTLSSHQKRMNESMNKWMNEWMNE